MYNICVAIQINSGVLSKSEAIIKDALKAGADLVEFRLDYMTDLEIISKDFVKQLLNLVQPKIPVILTFRAKSEGGQIEIDNDTRFNIIKTLLEAQPHFLDIEMNTNIKILSEIITLASQNQVNLIYSHHDFEKTPTFDSCIKILDEFNEKLKNIDISGTLNEEIFKLIFTAKTFDDNLIPLKLCHEITQKDQKIICFCMGEEGIFSRITCVKAGSYLTFASIGEKTAPGQIKIDKMREIHQLFFNIK